MEKNTKERKAESEVIDEFWKIDRDILNNAAYFNSEGRINPIGLGRYGGF